MRKTSYRTQLRALNDEQVVEILRMGRTVPQAELAEHYGVGRQTISHILHGQRYADVAPEIPRLRAIPRTPAGGRINCESCIHYAGAVHIAKNGRHRMLHRCSLGVPEISTDGVKFANECACYMA